MNQLFADLNTFINTSYVREIKTSEVVAKEYGLPLVTYEGGTALSSANGLNYLVKAEAEQDPRIYQAYVTMLNDWNEYVGPSDLFMDYYLDGPYDDIRNYGAIQTVEDTGSQKYDAMLSEIYPGGDANLDGSVDFADFEILESNYGLSNTWWEQGDFNDDGVVNWSDLNILRTNLDPAAVTLSQFAQIAIFGEPSVVTVGQVNEYDGYGVTYVSDMPWVSSSNGQGSVVRNETVNGSPISIGNLSFPSGLGV